MVGLELVELHFEVRRRQDIGQYHGVEVHSLLVAPERQHIALLARDRRLGGGSAAARLLLLLLGCGRGRLVLRLRVACQRGAVVSHVAAEGRREKGGGEGAKLDLALRDNGPGPYSMERRRERGAASLCPSPVREGDEDADKWTPGGEQTPRRWPRELTAEGEPAAWERDLFRQLPLGTRWRAGGCDATRPSVPRVAGSHPETPKSAAESSSSLRRASCARLGRCGGCFAGLLDLRG